MDYNSLVAPKGTSGSIANWIAYSDQILPLADILNDAQIWLYTYLRCREMQVTGFSIPLTQGALNYPLPTGFLDPLTMSGQYAQWIPLKDLPTIRRRRYVDGNGNPIQSQPVAYAVTGSTFEFDCAAYQTMTFTADYYGQPALLSVSNDTNFLTNRYSYLLRKACLMTACDFLDYAERKVAYEQELMGMIEAVQVKDDLAMRGGQVDPDYSESARWYGGGY
jgi:hypothetical protein